MENKKPIRVLCVFARLDRGGAESMCMNLYRNIDRTKIQFDFIKHTEDECQFDEEIRTLGGKIFIAPKYKIYNYFQYKAWWVKHLNEHPEHQIVHGHYYTISAIFLKIAKQCGRYTIGHSHSTKFMVRHWYDNVKYLLIRNVEKYCDLRLACSEEAGKFLYPSESYIVLNNAIDASLYRFNEEERKLVRTELNVNDNLVIGTVGRIFPVKNPFGIIEIFKTIHIHFPKAKLLWIGDGELRKAAENKIQEEGLTESVIMTGVRKDVYRLMQAMDVFVLPSLYEGLPVVSVEAQAAGLYNLLSDMVSKDTDVTGLCKFISLQDACKWADAVGEIVKNERNDTYQRIVDAGYDINTTVKWLEKIYLEIYNN